MHLRFECGVLYAILAFGPAEYEGPVVGDNAGRKRDSRRSVARFDDDEDDEDDDRPRRRGSRDDDEDYDDRPRRR